METDDSLKETAERKRKEEDICGKFIWHHF